MKYAENIEGFLTAFGPEPLSDGDLDRFYYSETMETRTGDKHDSPIDDIYDGCLENASTAYLLLGHKGCGKSTELNVLKDRLEVQGYRVGVVRCALEMDLIAPVAWDLLVLMAGKLLVIADEADCAVAPEIIASIASFWDDTEETKEIVKEEKASIEAGLEAKTPGLLKILLSLFAKVSAEIKIGETTRKEIHSTVERRISNWVQYIRYIADAIARKLGGKRPILIIEDVDKIDPKYVWELFYNYVAILSQMSFPVIYTFPISLSYSPKCSALDGYFTKKTLPMIKIRDAEGKRHRSGMDAIRRIVAKRADIKLFDAATLTLMIDKTGGSLRDLFAVITNAGKRAHRRGSLKIQKQDAVRALEELKSSLTRRIERKDYKFLQDIRAGNKTTIEDREMLLDMMQASVVLEYNGKRWHDVHPLVSDFLEEHVGDADAL